MASRSESVNRLTVLLAAAALALVAGCAGPQPRNGDPDPLEPANRVFFDINEGLDRTLIKPIAETYDKYTPQPAKTAISNFFANLNYLSVILNSFLQGKFGQGFSDTGRFIVNSTLGFGGLADVATDMGLPAHNEDFGQTLAVWGFGGGPYVYLPIQGPNATRDLPDIVTSMLLNPLTYISGGVLIPITALRVINLRANLLDETRIRDEAAVDSYSFTREAYLQRRNYLIHDGSPPSEGYDDIFDDADEEESSLKIE